MLRQHVRANQHIEPAIVSDLGGFERLKLKQSARRLIATLLVTANNAYSDDTRRV